MEDSWELVKVPAEIQHSTVGKEIASDGSEISLEKNEGNSKFKVCDITGNSWKDFDESLIQLFKMDRQPSRDIFKL